MKEDTNTYTPSSVVYSSLLVALFVDTKAVNYVLGAFMGTGDEGYTTLLFAIIAVSSLTILLLHTNILDMEVNLYVWLFSAFIMFFYYYTSSMIERPRVPLPFLLGFTLLAFNLPSLLKIDPRLTLRAAMTIPAIGVFLLGRVFIPEEENELGTVSMMRSYAFLVPVMANILYYLLYHKSERLSKDFLFLIISVINLIYLYKILSHGSRGPFLCIASLILFHWVLKKDESGNLIWSAGKNLTIGIIIMVIISFFKEIIFGISAFLNGLGIHLNVIDKFVRKSLETGDMSNGRTIIYQRAIQDIPDNLFFGHGMDLFEHNTGIAYPHNFILQIFYDGGLMLALLLLIPVIWCLIKKIRFDSHETYSMTLFLFFISVPGALVSSDLWQNERLWLFFGAMLSSSFIYEVERRYEE